MTGIDNSIRDSLVALGIPQPSVGWDIAFKTKDKVVLVCTQTREKLHIARAETGKGILLHVAYFYQSETADATHSFNPMTLPEDNFWRTYFSK